MSTMKLSKCLLLLFLIGASLSVTAQVHAADKPNIVLILMDNFGWGEFGAYGGGILRHGSTSAGRSHATSGNGSISICI